MPSFVIPLIVLAVVVVVAFVLFRMMWRFAEPNKAMIITGGFGRGKDDEASGQRIVLGRGAFVIPGIHQVRFLGLNLHEVTLRVECVTTQGIPVKVIGVVAFKVANDFVSIANSAQRFLGAEQQMDSQAHAIFDAHLRSIVGSLTVEQLIRDRDALSRETRESAAVDMQKLGLLLDTLQIQELDDPTGYIENLAKPHIAQVQRDARIAQAQTNQAAAEQEAAATAAVAEAQRGAQIKQAGFAAEVQEAQATASQAGPLADAKARQAVVAQETEVATVTAQRTEAELNATVKKRADADAYQAVTHANAERTAQIATAEAESQAIRLRAAAQAEQTRLIGQAEGDAIAARGVAEGNALKARAEGLAANQDAVINQTVAEKLPDVITAAAKVFDNVETLTVLNGGHGLMEMLGEVIAQGGATLKTVRSSLNTNATPDGQNGQHDWVTEPVTSSTAR